MLSIPAIEKRTFLCSKAFPHLGVTLRNLSKHASSFKAYIFLNLNKNGFFFKVITILISYGKFTTFLVELPLTSIAYTFINLYIVSTLNYNSFNFLKEITICKPISKNKFKFKKSLHSNLNSYQFDAWQSLSSGTPLSYH